MSRQRLAPGVEVATLLDGLRRELDSIKAAIEALEELAKTEIGAKMGTKSGRGRKSMGAAERLTVSARMRKYWAKRLSDQAKAKSTQPEKPSG
jgi:hypothetical protein